MSKANGNGTPGETDYELRVPEGMDPMGARMAFEQIASELHALEPLLPMALKLNVANGLLGDIIPLQKLRHALLEAPRGAMWGISITRPSRLLGGKDEGAILHAHSRVSECTTLDEVILTASCFAFLTSAPARGVLTMHGYRIGIQRPAVPEHADDGTSA